jgi:hypothetical protein
MAPLQCVRSCGAAKGLGKEPYFHIGFVFPIASKFGSKKKINSKTFSTAYKTSFQLSDANFKFRLKSAPEIYN